ncbi:hypothetical protein [Prosthecobacter sp.]|uniref:hypothetical protein n=1 Tax=Prosthecobacter sp. TaxID=1965333 RepID=UPI001D93710B|nr:hypothetical protein [Prosthecobacter sp.]MCB1277613.1 hypothetical protein [Prosthecobacter sp.]
MHPLAPSRAPVALIDQTEVARQRRRRGKPRVEMMRLAVILVAGSAVASGVWWLREETPHPHPEEAVRESPLVEARSLKPLLETTQPAKMAAYAMKKDAGMANRAPVEVRMEIPEPVALPVWLVADGARSAELLRQELRERGARQMGKAVRLAMLNVAELLAMDEEAWDTGLKTVAANENQTSALLLTFYLHYLDHGGDAAGVAALRKAVNDGVPQARAVREHVLAGRSVEEFEREMGAAFAAAGIELHFTRRGGAVFHP